MTLTDAGRAFGGAGGSPEKNEDCEHMYCLSVNFVQLYSTNYFGTRK